MESKVEEIDDDEVPKLLLQSENEFVDDYFTFYFTWGYNIKNFQLTLILYKNNDFQILSIDDCKTICECEENVWTFFNGEQCNDYHLIIEAGPKFNVTMEENQKYFQILNKKKNLLFNQSEWKGLLGYSKKIVYFREWYDMKTKEIEKNYQDFIQIFIQSRESSEPFLNNFLNSNQLFKEFYTLCDLKVKSDLENYYNTCK